jgi:hypothetical protein
MVAEGRTTQFTHDSGRFDPQILLKSLKIYPLVSPRAIHPLVAIGGHVGLPGRERGEAWLTRRATQGKRSPFYIHGPGGRVRHCGTAGGHDEGESVAPGWSHTPDIRLYFKLSADPKGLAADRESIVSRDLRTHCTAQGTEILKIRPMDLRIGRNTGHLEFNAVAQYVCCS